MAHDGYPERDHPEEYYDPYSFELPSSLSARENVLHERARKGCFPLLAFVILFLFLFWMLVVQGDGEKPPVRPPTPTEVVPRSSVPFATAVPGTGAVRPGAPTSPPTS